MVMKWAVGSAAMLGWFKVPEANDLYGIVLRRRIIERLGREILMRCGGFFLGIIPLCNLNHA